MSSQIEMGRLCVGCDSCVLICPQNAILKVKNDLSIETWSCTLCNLCIEVCPVENIKMVSEGQETLRS